MSTDPADTERRTQTRAIPGWYDDPWDSSRFRYWDGSQWTERVKRKNPGPSFEALMETPVRLVAACGGLTLAASPFLPWASVVLLGDLSLFQLLSLGGNPNTFAWLAIGIGAGVVFTAYAASTTKMVRGVAIGLGALAGLFAVLILTAMVNDAEEAAGLVRVSWGPLVAAAGCGAMVIAGFLPDRRQATDRRDSGSISELERLQNLRDAGMLTDAELEAEKRRVLGH